MIKKPEIIKNSKKILVFNILVSLNSSQSGIWFVHLEMAQKMDKGFKRMRSPIKEESSARDAIEKLPE